MIKRIGFLIGFFCCVGATVGATVELTCSETVPHTTFEDGRDYRRAWKACLSKRYCPSGWYYVYTSRTDLNDCSLTSIPNMEVPNSPNDPLDNWCCP